MAETIEIIKFQSGDSVEIHQIDSMWFAEAEGRHFLARTKQGLIEILKSLGHVTWRTLAPPVGTLLWHLSLLELENFGRGTKNKADEIVPQILKRFDAKTLADISDGQLETLRCEENIHVDSNLYKLLAHRRQLSRLGINVTYEATYTPMVFGSPLETPAPVLETPAPVLETLVSTMNSDLPLSSKQEAWIQLKALAETNDAAKQIVANVLAEPFSPTAREIVRAFGKPDFLEVSYEDLVRYVDNLVRRSSLVLELSRRFRII